MLSTSSFVPERPAEAGRYDLVFLLAGLRPGLYTFDFNRPHSHDWLCHVF
jgi:hypothetical protein